MSSDLDFAPAREPSECEVTAGLLGEPAPAPAPASAPAPAAVKSGVRGIAYIVISALFFSVMTICVKKTGGRIHTFQLIGTRCYVPMVFCASALVRERINPFGYGPAKSALLVLRGFVGLANMLAFFYSLQLLSLADAQVIAFTSTVMTGVIGRLVLGEAFGPIEMSATGIAFVGLVFVVQPAFLFGAHAAASATPPGVTVEQRFVGVFIALLSAAFAASTYLVTRTIGPAVSVHAVAFVLAGVASAGSTALMVVTGTGSMPRGLDWLFVTALALAGLIVMLSFNRGCQLEDAVVANLVRVLDIPLALAWQVVLGESVTLLSALGIVLIMGAVVCVGVHKLRTRRRASATLALNASSSDELGVSRVLQSASSATSLSSDLAGVAARLADESL